MDKVLIIRFSALGDICMTLPVIESVCKTYPNTHFTLLTSNMGASVANTILELPNFSVRGVDIKKCYKGIGGLNRLYSELKKDNYNIVADLHDVLRSKYLSFRFILGLAKVRTIDKGRLAKKKLVTHKINYQLMSTFQRYQKVFLHLGFKSDLSYDANQHRKKLQSAASKTNYKIGIAPFAQHQGKQYPLSKMLDVITLLIHKMPEIQIYLYGAPNESAVLEEWATKYPNNVISFAGKQTIADDIRSMADLNVMLTMDSSNMHMASLVGTRCVSIWGNTHPFAGFLGYSQKMEDVVQLDLSCRPCSIYGKGKCEKQDYECIKKNSPEIIVQKLL